MTTIETNEMTALATDTDMDSGVLNPAPGAGGDEHPSSASYKSALTSAQAGKAPSSSLLRKTYAELQEEAKSLTFLDFHISHANGRSDGIDRKLLSDDDFSTFVHDVLKIPKNICLAYDYFPGSQNLKIIQVKPDADISKFTPPEPVPFKDFLIEIRSSKSSVTKVTFLYAGLDIPNEEILNLCDYYGEPLSIEHVKMANAKNKGDRSAKRVVWMKLAPNKVMNNYYWLESIIPGRAACRVLVLHEGQGKQCNHCLKVDIECPAGAEGPQCRTFNKTPKRDAATYMRDVKSVTGYKSLREKHLRAFPLLQGESNQSDEPRFQEEGVALATELANTELGNKVKELSDALKEENAKVAAAEQSIVKEKFKADALQSQRITVTNTLDNMIVDYTNENPSINIDPGSKLDQLLTMRAENTAPADPTELDNWDMDSTVDTLSELLVDQSGRARELQEKCIESIIEKVNKTVKGRRLRLSLCTSAGNASRLLEKSPGRIGRPSSRGARGTGSPAAFSRSPSLKRSSLSITPVVKETKIPRVTS